MKIIDIWKERLDAENAAEAYEQYLQVEKEVYAKILSEKKQKFNGTVAEIAKEFSMETWIFAGFLDGISTSLEQDLDVEELTEQSTLEFTLDFNKLYYNMLKAKAQWLYELEEWDAVLDTEQRAQIKKQYVSDHTAVRDKVGRNDPCPCGSGKKYKKCCGK